MREFKAFHHPVFGYEIVKVGFSWPAWFFVWFWILYKRLWSYGIIWILATWAFAASLEWAQPQIGHPNFDQNPFGFWLQAIFMLIIIFLLYKPAFSGNKWLEKRLLKTGYTTVGMFQAETPGRALAMAASGQAGLNMGDQNTSIDALSNSGRISEFVANVLRENGITNLSDIQGRTERDLKSLPGIGDVTYQKLIRLIDEYGVGPKGHLLNQAGSETTTDDKLEHDARPSGSSIGRLVLGILVVIVFVFFVDMRGFLISIKNFLFSNTEQVSNGENSDSSRVHQKPIAAHNIIELGNKAYSEGNFFVAKIHYQTAADAGNPEGLNGLADLYEAGQGVEQNYNEAFGLYKLAADKGFAPAQANLGIMYDTARGVPEDNERAVKLYRLSAQQKDARGQLLLGLMYEEGEGISKNLKEAVRLFKLSAVQENAEAMFQLGEAYDDGEGTRLDDAEAARWYSKAAILGHSNAQFNLAVMYHDGEGVDKNIERAIEWFQKSAEQDNAFALNQLGLLYDEGKGVNLNSVKAHGYFLKAAELGLASAQYNVGVMYENGEGIKEDRELAIKWFKAAAEQEFEEAVKRLKAINGH